MTAPSFTMQDAFSAQKKSSPMSISEPLRISTPSTIELDKKFCSSEGCFVDTPMMLQNLDKIPEEVIESCELLSIHPDYTFDKNSTSLIAIKEFFTQNKIAGKVYYKEPINLHIIRELYTALGRDINSKTTYVVTDIDRYPSCYGIKIKIKDGYTVTIKNRKDDLVSLPEIYIVLQYPCQTDIFNIVNESLTPSLSQSYYRKLQKTFVKNVPKLFNDLIELHNNDFILHDIKLENIVYCGKQDDDFRHIDFSYGTIKYNDWIEDKPEKVYFSYVIEPIYDFVNLRKKLSRNKTAYTEEDLHSYYELFKIIFKLNDVYVLLYAWGLAINHQEFLKFNTNKSIIDLDLLEYARSRFFLDQADHMFILQYLYKLKEDIKTLMSQNIKQTMDPQLYNTMNTLVYILEQNLRGFMPGGSKQSKIQQFINQYTNKYFISEKVTQQPYIKTPFYIYKITNIVSSKNRTIGLSRYKIDLKKNPTMSLKNLKGQKEEAKLSNNLILKVETDRLIPL